MIKKGFILAFLLIITICFCSLCFAWQGKVVGIADGDTITVLHDGNPEKIRLYGIDCPEKRQAFGTKAKQFASRTVFNKIVDIRAVTKDRYGRTIAWVNYNGSSLNEDLLRAGLAWHYKKYSSDSKLSVLEIIARQNKMGLWADSNPIPPWDFRRGGKSATNKRAVKKPATSVRADGEAVIYHGNYSSKKFHRPDCRYYNCVKCTEIFQSRDEAISAGYKPCKICNP